MLSAYAAFSTLAAPGLPPVKKIYWITVEMSSLIVAFIRE